MSKSKGVLLIKLVTGWWFTSSLLLLFMLIYCYIWKINLIHFISKLFCYSIFLLWKKLFNFYLKKQKPLIHPQIFKKNIKHRENLFHFCYSLSSFIFNQQHLSRFFPLEYGFQKKKDFVSQNDYFFLIWHHDNRALHPLTDSSFHTFIQLIFHKNHVKFTTDSDAFTPRVHHSKEN